MAEQKVDSVPQILINYLTSKNYIIMTIVCDILMEVNRVNLLFQHDNADICKIYNDLYTLLLVLLQIIVKPIFLKNLNEMSEHNFKTIKIILDNNLALITVDLLDFGFVSRERIAETNMTPPDIMFIKKNVW